MVLVFKLEHWFSISKSKIAVMSATHLEQQCYSQATPGRRPQPVTHLQPVVPTPQAGWLDHRETHVYGQNTKKRECWVPCPQSTPPVKSRERVYEEEEKGVSPGQQHTSCNPDTTEASSASASSARPLRSKPPLTSIILLTFCCKFVQFVR